MTLALQDLPKLQFWLQQSLIYQNDDPVSADQILTPSRLTAQQQLGIYQRSYYSRLLSCLREQFPALCHALGADLFNDFAREYLVDCPSDTYTLYEIGRRFPEYLADTRPDADLSVDTQESWIHFMIDLARFERQVFVLFDAPGAEQQGYANANIADSEIQLQPCFALGEYRFDVARYYHQVRKGECPILPSIGVSRIALVRKNFLTQTVPLTQAHFIFLNAMASGVGVDHSLISVAQQLKVDYQQVKHAWQKVDAVRNKWFELGLFIKRG